MAELAELMTAIGHEIRDAEEETFLLFSQNIPSSNLGFIDSKSGSIEISLAGRDYVVSQSPTLLTSNRQGGTTGAVLWKITPVFAEWISSKDNILWSSKILTPESTVAELGCGVSGLVGLSLAPSIAHYIATDQEYVHKLFKENIQENIKPISSTRQPGSHRHQGRRQRGRKSGPQASTLSSRSSLHAGGDEDTDTNDRESGNNITFASLDWETDNPHDLKTLINRRSTSTAASNSHKDDDAEPSDPGFDVLIACDCIYNDALIAPFVRTCAELCQLRPAAASDLGGDGAESRPQTGDRDGRDDGSLLLLKKPTFCIIAQQLRSPEVFEEWVREALGYFRMWRMSDEVVGEKLGSGSGYVVHLLLLRDSHA